MCDNIDSSVMEEGGGSVASQLEPLMGNKHGGAANKNHNNNHYVNGNGHLSNSFESDSKYVSIVDVSFSSPQYFSTREESLHQSIEVNSPVKMNGEVKVNGVDSLKEVNGDLPMDENEDIVNRSVIVVVEPAENGQSVSRVSINGGLDHFENSTCENGHNGNVLDLSTSYVDLMHHESNFFTVSPILNKYLSPRGSSTPFNKQLPPELPPENESLNESFIENRSPSSIEDSLNHSSMTGEELETIVREKLKRQRSGSSDYWQDDVEDHSIVDFLGKSTDDAEARLAAKRQARAEAREIRMRELERLQRESEDNDRVYDIYSTPDGVGTRPPRACSVTTPRTLLSSNNSYHSSRRSSEDSLEEVNSIRDVRMELKECEEKFRKAMVANAQLDNEKAALAFQVDLFKDKYEELEEQHHQLSREHKETCRQFEQTKRHRTKLQEDLDVSRAQLEELLQLIQEKGLVVVEGEQEDDEGEEGEQRTKPPRKALVSAEVADVLQHGSGSLDVRLKRFVEERNELLDELRRVKLELEEERASRGRHANGPSDDQDDVHREAHKLLGDYKFKLQKAEQDVNTMQANVARLESQVIRYKSIAETSEKLEDELKLEKRKLQRELREAQARVEELETSHSHLQRRLDKLKNAKSALLKDL